MKIDAKLLVILQLEAAVGKVKIQKPVIDYLEFSPKDPELDEDKYGHLVEIYDFSSSLKTEDLMKIFVPSVLVHVSGNIVRNIVGIEILIFIC